MTQAQHIVLGERGLKKGNTIRHGVYHKNMRIFYGGKIVSTCDVQDCNSYHRYSAHIFGVCILCWGRAREILSSTEESLKNALSNYYPFPNRAEDWV